LAWILAHHSSRVTAHVVFCKAAGAPPGWERDDLWRQATAIPGVNLLADHEARETVLFQARTSGQVVVYDPRGRLLFRGGITPVRGHPGDNAGRRAVVACLVTGCPGPRETSVFGCPLLEDNSPCNGGRTTCTP
jgi:hypothetical protein